MRPMKVQRTPLSEKYLETERCLESDERRYAIVQLRRRMGAYLGLYGTKDLKKILLRRL